MGYVSGWLKEEIASFCDLFFFSFLSLLFSFDRCCFELLIRVLFVYALLTRICHERERFETRADGK